MAVPEGHVFLSHSRANQAFVKRLAADLKARGINVWLDQWELSVGDSLVERIQAGIRNAGYLAVALSTHSVESRWVGRELNAALAEELRRRGVFILPLLLEDCDIPLFIQDKVYADFRQSYSEGLDAILRTVIPGDRTPPKLIFDTESDPQFRTWAVHCSDGAREAQVIPAEPGRIAVSASDRQSVGLNKSVPTLHGRVSFEYRVVSAGSHGDHIYFAMIPIQETGYSRSGVIEVGTERPADPRNPGSRHRLRYRVPAAHQSDESWHSATLDFDFRDTPTAFYSIFAFRINEGVEHPSRACVEIGMVRVYSW